jgi:hypothetical protein
MCGGRGKVECLFLKGWNEEMAGLAEVPIVGMDRK